jgi:hypothetical protein
MKRENPLTNGGGLLLALGALAFLPPLFDRQLLITAWLGDMQQPVGLSAMIVGGILFAIGKLQDFRNASPVISPTDPLVMSQTTSSTTAASAQAASAPAPAAAGGTIGEPPASGTDEGV